MSPAVQTFTYKSLMVTKLQPRYVITESTEPFHLNPFLKTLYLMHSCIHSLIQQILTPCHVRGAGVNTEKWSCVSGKILTPCRDTLVVLVRFRGRSNIPGSPKTCFNTTASNLYTGFCVRVFKNRTPLQCLTHSTYLGTQQSVSVWRPLT
jgi:hypothetical protein